MKKCVSTLLFVCLVVFLMAGCGTNPGLPFATETPDTTAGETATATGAPTPTIDPTPTIESTPTPGITEYRIGFVVDAYTHEGVNYIKIDYVQFLTGEEAVEAAKEDGFAEQDADGTWYVPNDYYVNNDSTKLRTIPLSNDCTIKIVDYSGGGLAMTEIPFGDMRVMDLTGGRMLMYVDVVDGFAESLEEQYRP